MRRPLAVLVLVLAVSCSSSPPTSIGLARISRPAPSVVGPTVQGGRFANSAYRGKVLVVNFWNEYCGPCRREQPQIELSWERLRDRVPVQFVGVNYVGGDWPDQPSAARSYIDDFAVSYPSVFDPRQRLSRAFGIRGIPTTFVADTRGRLRYEIQGPVRPFELDRLVRRVLRR